MKLSHVISFILGKKEGKRREIKSIRHSVLQAPALQGKGQARPNPRAVDGWNIFYREQEGSSGPERQRMSRNLHGDGMSH